MHSITAKWQEYLLAQGVKVWTDSRTHLDLTTINLSYKVKVAYEDGSQSVFNYANFYEDDADILIVTEHCGFHEVKKLGAKVKRTPMSPRRVKKLPQVSRELAKALTVLLK